MEWFFVSTFKVLSLWAGLKKLVVELIKYFLIQWSIYNFFFPYGQWFFFFPLQSFIWSLGLWSLQHLGGGSLIFCSEVPFPELSNASVYLLAAVVCFLWSHEPKLGGCKRELRELQQLSQHFLFTSALPSCLLNYTNKFMRAQLLQL